MRFTIIFFLGLSSALANFQPFYNRNPRRLEQSGTSNDKNNLNPIEFCYFLEPEMTTPTPFFLPNDDDHVQVTYIGRDQARERIYVPPYIERLLNKNFDPYWYVKY